MIHKLKNPRLHVITTVSNPIRYNKRYELFSNFIKYLQTFKNVRVTTVEAAFGERQTYFTGPEDMNTVTVRGYDELWYKENLINIAMSRLPESWEYVAWIDSDITFSREDWVSETLHQLQHYMFVQMFETAIDMGPAHQALKVHNGFVSQYLKGAKYKTGYHDWHPGFAWAARREAIEATGGLYDRGILGSGDRHMACSLVGRAEHSYSKNLTKGYTESVHRWQKLAERHIKRDIGFVPGTIIHNWHGKKADRQYGTRWQILERNQFDPLHDLKRDWQGLWQLEVHSARQIRLRDEIRQYFRSRNEDSIDLE